MQSLNDFVSAMRTLFAQPLDDAGRWDRVKPLLGTLLADPALVASAQAWPPSQVKTNLLFYQDPDYGFVVNGLIKNRGDATPIHDHAHTWTAYGVIEGKEHVCNYTVMSEDGDFAQIEAAGEYDVEPGHIEVVPPFLPHAEIAQSRTVAIIVRSQRLGSFPQRVFDVDTGRVHRLPGPTPIPFELTT